MTDIQWQLHKYNHPSKIPADVPTYSVILANRIITVNTGDWLLSGTYFDKPATMAYVLTPDVSYRVVLLLTNYECEFFNSISNKNGFIMSEKSSDQDKAMYPGYLIIRNATTLAGQRESTIIAKGFMGLSVGRVLIDLYKKCDPSRAVLAAAQMVVVPAANKMGYKTLASVVNYGAHAASFGLNPLGYLTGQGLSFVADKVADKVQRSVLSRHDLVNDFFKHAAQETSYHATPIVAKKLALLYKEYGAQKRRASDDLEQDDLKRQRGEEKSKHVPEPVDAKELLVNAENLANVGNPKKDDINKFRVSNETAKLLAENRWGPDRSQWNEVEFKDWETKVFNAYDVKKRGYERAVPVVSNIINQTQTHAVLPELLDAYKQNIPLTQQFQQTLFSLEQCHVIAFAVAFETSEKLKKINGNPLSSEQISQIHNGVLDTLERPTKHHEDDIVKLAVHYMLEYCNDGLKEQLIQASYQTEQLAQSFAKGEWNDTPSDCQREMPRISKHSTYVINEAIKELLKGGLGINVTFNGDKTMQATAGTAKQPTMVKWFEHDFVQASSSSYSSSSSSSSTYRMSGINFGDGAEGDDDFERDPVALVAEATKANALAMGKMGFKKIAAFYSAVGDMITAINNWVHAKKDAGNLAPAETAVVHTAVDLAVGAIPNPIVKVIESASSAYDSMVERPKSIPPIPQEDLMSKNIFTAMGAREQHATHEAPVVLDLILRAPSIWVSGIKNKLTEAVKPSEAGNLKTVGLFAQPNGKAEQAAVMGSLNLQHIPHTW